MIDNDLIDQCSAVSIQAVTNPVPTKFECVYVVNNVLHVDMIHKLYNYIKTVDPLKWHAVTGQEHNNRQSIVWDADTVIEELHETFSRTTSQINQLFDSADLNFIGVQLWCDQQGYYTGLHQDNIDIDVSCQIYLFDNNPVLGTTFVRDEHTVEIPYKNNSGYLMINNQDSKLYHTTSCTTPAGVTRYSVYAVWSRTAKQ